MNLFQPDDVGTRYQHYRELLDVWENTLPLFDGYAFRHAQAAKRKERLVGAIETMTNQIDALTGYNDARPQLSRMIDRIHRETQLPGV